MPITQDRITQIIRAGQDYQQAFHRLCELIEKERKLVRDERQSLADAMQNIWTMAMPAALLRNEGLSLATLRIESEHFRRNAARNRASAKWAKRKRREAGTPEAQLGGIRAIEARIAAENAATEDFIAKPTAIPRGRLSEDTRRRVEEEALRALAETQPPDETASADAGVAALLRGNEDVTDKPPGSYDGPPLEEEEEE